MQPRNSCWLNATVQALLNAPHVEITIQLKLALWAMLEVRVAYCRC